MNKRCPNCELINYVSAESCIRCGTILDEIENISSHRGLHNSSLPTRAGVRLAVLMTVLTGFYTSLILSADRLTPSEQAEVRAALRILEQKGFRDEAFILKHLTVFRRNDNWLNASVEKENAYAATNFPFEIVTLYPDFFRYPVDDVERAAILLHEAKHLQGKDEKEAYEFVWKNRQRLGWTSAGYRNSVIWRETRKLTKEHVPNVFVCDFKEYGDCSD